MKPQTFFMAKTIVDAESNISEKKTRKSPVPKDTDRIISGALQMNLESRIDLCKKLQASINAEVKDRQALADQAAKLADGLLTQNH